MDHRPTDAGLERGCQANNTDILRIKRSICARRFPKGDAPNGRRKRSESPLVGRWGKAPYPKMLRYLLFEMFGLSLTVPAFCLRSGTSRACGRFLIPSRARKNFRTDSDRILHENDGIRPFTRRDCGHLSTGAQHIVDNSVRNGRVTVDKLHFRPKIFRQKSLENRAFF